MPDSLPGSNNSGGRRRTSLLPWDQRPADGFHQKLIVHRQAFIQPQTVLPTLIRKFFSFITGTIFRLPALKPAGLYFMCCSVHSSLVLTALVGDIPDFAVTTRQTHQFMIH